MLKRAFSTVLLWAVLISAICFFKSRGFSFLMLVLALLSSWEACKILEKCSLKPSFPCVAAASVILFAPFLFLNTFWDFNKGDCLSFLPCVAFGALFAVVAAIACLRAPYGDFVKSRVLTTLGCIFYIPLSLSILAAISCASPNGIYFAIWLIGCAKFCDVGGYIFGCAFGKHKIAPTISPLKSWEGLFGGMFMSALFSIVLTLSLELATSIAPHIAMAAIAMFIIAPISLISDLLESALKRRAGVKDSGSTIPGIGGALDLADSILLCCPTAFFIIAIVQIGMLIFK